MKAKLSKTEKKVLCIKLAKYLPQIRSLLNVNQKEFGSICGISTDRLSRIENKHVVMTWSQAIAVIAVANMNAVTKEFLYLKNIVPMKFYQYIQGLDESIPPIMNVLIRDEVLNYTDNMKGKEDF